MSSLRRVTPHRVLFWLHLGAGVIAGTVIFFLAATGTLLAFEHEITSLVDHRAATARAAQPRVAVDAIVIAARDTTHTPPAAITVHADPALPVEVSAGRDQVLLFDPQTGAPIGGARLHVRNFFNQVTTLHRWFGFQGESRTTARAIKGVFTLAFGWLLLSGLYLWLPRAWNALQLRNRLLFQPQLQGRARHWNRHNVIGVWLAAPLSVIVLTGVVMAYPWANNLLYRIAGDTPPPAGDGPARTSAPGRTAGQHDRHHGADSDAAPSLSLDALFAAVEQQSPGWRAITLRQPQGSAPKLTFSVDPTDAGSFRRRQQLTVDAKTGRILRTEDFSSYSRGRRWRMWARFLHTGEAGGLAGKALAALAALGATVLVWTGFAMAWIRFTSWKARRGKHRPPAPQAFVPHKQKHDKPALAKQ